MPPKESNEIHKMPEEKSCSTGQKLWAAVYNGLGLGNARGPLNESIPGDELVCNSRTGKLDRRVILDMDNPGAPR